MDESLSSDIEMIMNSYQTNFVQQPVRRERPDFYHLHIFKESSPDFSAILIAKLIAADFFVATANYSQDLIRAQARIMTNGLFLFNHRHQIRVRRFQLRYNMELGIYIAGEISLLTIGNQTIYSHSSGLGMGLTLNHNHFIGVNAGANIMLNLQSPTSRPVIGNFQYEVRF